MGVNPKNRGGKTHPNHPFVHRVWNHYFHHPFWDYQLMVTLLETNISPENGGDLEIPNLESIIFRGFCC